MSERPRHRKPATFKLDDPDGPLSAVAASVITAGPGLYVCIAGGVVAAIGALFAASRR